jgi:hypothetical protein
MKTFLLAACLLMTGVSFGLEVCTASGDNTDNYEINCTLDGTSFKTSTFPRNPSGSGGSAGKADAKLLFYMTNKGFRFTGSIVYADYGRQYYFQKD